MRQLVYGLVFSHDLSELLLQVEARPGFGATLVGFRGPRFPDENGQEAISRIFQHETGVLERVHWKQFGEKLDRTGETALFIGLTESHVLETAEVAEGDCQVTVIRPNLDFIYNNGEHNLASLVGLAMNFLQTGMTVTLKCP